MKHISEIVADNEKVAADQLQERLHSAEHLLRLVFVEMKHAEFCPFGKFHRHNRHLPAQHSAWKSAPPCECLVGGVEKFLLELYQ